MLITLVLFLGFMLAIVVGVGLGHWYFAMALLPLVYGLPRSSYWLAKGRISRGGVWIWFSSPIIWTAVYGGAWYLCVNLVPEAPAVALVLGLALGVVRGGFAFIFKRGAAELNRDFLTTLGPFLTPAGMLFVATRLKGTSGRCG